MNRFLVFITGCRLRSIRWGWALVLAFSLTVNAAVADATAGTNWLSLADLLKKWEPVSLPEIQRAAEAGDITAAHYLGYCYGEGSRVTRSADQALVWYQRALQAGYLPSASNIGLLYQRGLSGSSNDMGKAVYYYTYGAERGLAQAQANLGMLYRDGNGVPQDPAQAMRWFRLAAAQGHATAMVEIGRLYRFGQGVKTNVAEAHRWFETAATEKNSSLAELNLGLLYEDQGELEKALTFYRQAADAGSTDAMIQLYLCYWNVKGVSSDHAKAVEWLGKAANAGNPYAQCLLGCYYETPRWEGEGRERALTAPNWHQAIHWYRLSAEQNWAGGQYHLGMLYVRGTGVEVDEVRGLKLVRAAVDDGLDAAASGLAELYAGGIGTPRNDADRPIELLWRCKSWDNLIFRHETGLGTERDFVAAAECYCEAAMSNAQYYWRYSLWDKIEFHPGKPQSAVRPSWAPDGHHVQIQLPVPYEDGSDDLRRALSLYLKSAKGDGQAALQIGNRYLAGQDAPPIPNPRLGVVHGGISRRFNRSTGKFKGTRTPYDRLRAENGEGKIHTASPAVAPRSGSDFRLI